MMKKEILFKVDGKTLKTKQGESILKACYTAYIDIPRFCYHEGLRIAGNCRMCLVEVANSRKLIASCATPLLSSFSVFTKTFRVKKARQAVLEFLLINHPLDCPICDQGGECDLQDITLVFGGDRGRFYEFSKRAVFDKNLGPLIKTVMNRCIHCTRCVRFFQETSFSVKDRLGLLGRGSATEIGTYIPNFMLSELSGNVIDLCPVGALTSKPFAFKARSWELFSQYTYDVVDCLMPRVRFDLVGKNILRVLPYMGVYQSGWINNRTRFCYDALNMQRQESCLWNFSSNLSNSLIYSKKKTGEYVINKIYINITWEDSFSILLRTFLVHLKNRIKGVVSSLISLEYMWVIKQFFSSFGIQKILFEDFKDNKGDVDFRRTFVFDFPLELFDMNLWQVFLLNLNLRMEAPLMFLHFKKLKNKGFLNVFSCGSNFLNLDGRDIQVGVSSNLFLKFLEGRSSNLRLFLRHVLFHNILVMTNLEVVLRGKFKQLQLLVEYFFFLLETQIYKRSIMEASNSMVFCNKLNYTFTVLQRYSGLISYSEIGFFRTVSDVSDLFPGLNFFFDISFVTNVRYSNLDVKKDFNVLFNATTFDVSSLDGFFNLLLPVRHIYEVEGSYLDVFLKKKKSSMILSVESTRKDLKDVLLAFNLFAKKVLKFSWVMFFFSSLFVNMKTVYDDFLFDIITGSLNDAVNMTELGFLYLDKYKILFQKSLFFYSYISDIVGSKGFFFFFSQWISVLSTLNFYDDGRMNLLNFSKSMRQSSISYEQTNLNLSFTL